MTRRLVLRWMVLAAAIAGLSWLCAGSLDFERRLNPALAMSPYNFRGKPQYSTITLS